MSARSLWEACTSAWRRIPSNTRAMLGVGVALLVIITYGQRQEQRAFAWRVERDTARAQLQRSATELADAKVRLTHALSVNDSLRTAASGYLAIADAEHGRADSLRRLVPRHVANLVVTHHVAPDTGSGHAMTGLDLPGEQSVGALPTASDSADAYRVAAERLERAYDVLDAAYATLKQSNVTLTAANDSLRTQVATLTVPRGTLDRAIGAEKAADRTLAESEARCRILFFPCPSRTVTAVVATTATAIVAALLK